MGADINALNEPFRTAVKALVAESGGKVTWTSTRRTRAEQAALRIKNGCPDVYSSPASSCDIPTARPGESNHESGDAIDFTNTDAVIAEVERLAPKYGLVRTVPGERWHYELAPGGWAEKVIEGDVTISSGNPLAGNPLGSVTDAVRGIVAALGIIGDPRTWLRALYIIGGLVLVAAGLALLGVDLKGRVVEAAIP